MAAWVSRNKSLHLLEFPLRHGECFTEGLPLIYALLSLSRSLVETDVSASTLLVAIVTPYYEFSHKWSCTEVKKHFRSSKYHYEIHFWLGWDGVILFSPSCSLFCVAWNRCNGTKWKTIDENQICTPYCGRIKMEVAKEFSYFSCMKEVHIRTEANHFHYCLIVFCICFLLNYFVKCWKTKTFLISQMMTFYIT